MKNNLFSILKICSCIKRKYVLENHANSFQAMNPGARTSSLLWKCPVIHTALKNVLILCFVNYNNEQLPFICKESCDVHWQVCLVDTGDKKTQGLKNLKNECFSFQCVYTVAPSNEYKLHKEGLLFEKKGKFHEIHGDSGTKKF